MKRLTPVGFGRVVGVVATVAFLLTPCPATPPPNPGGVCPVHGIKMESRELPVVYGMPSSAEFAEREVSERQFPHGRDYVLGGCVLRPTKTVSGQLCSLCVAARKAWLEKYNAAKNRGVTPTPSRP